MTSPAAVLIAIGGNSLIRDGERGTIAEQFENSRSTARQIGALVSTGWQVVVTHGNGPQVGFILLRSELVGGDPTIPRLSLDMAVADSQGGLGYIVGNSLVSELARVGHRDRVACLLTQTVVDADDPAFARPAKPIGAFFTVEEAQIHRTRDRWVMVEDAGRGYRRVVPSPYPREIVEWPAVRSLADNGSLVIAAGGGGVPVIVREGRLVGVEAVIDKDFASRLLANLVGAGTLVLLTGVERVAVDFGTPQQRPLDEVDVETLQRYEAEGQFPAGSMGPKVRAAIEFVERGGGRALITSPEGLVDAVAGRAGTQVLARHESTLKREEIA